MSSISAADVKKLRVQTGAGMMDCKKALVEAEGDFEKAIAFLRKRGQKLSAKRAERDAKEGVVLTKINDDGTKGVVVRLSCETDFVSKNEDFIKLTSDFVNIALNTFPLDLNAFLAEKFDDITVGEKVTEQVGVIGEKIELADYQKLEADQVVSYVHMGNKAGVLIGLNNKSEEAAQAGKDVAMQVAAMHPIAVDKDGVDPTLIEKEIEIGKAQAREQGKPEDLIEKIAMGKLNKFFSENTLLNQQFVKDNKMKVKDYLKSIAPDLTVTEFKHVKLG